MNKILVTVMVSTIAFHVSAQSVQDGEKMISYGRFESAAKVLRPLSEKDPQANYYLGLAELGLEKSDAAKQTFAKYPDNFYNQAGTARILFAEGKKDEATKVLYTIVDKAKKKEWEKYKVAADAITYTTGGNINDAINWYTKSVEISANANSYIAMGDAYLKTQSGGGMAMTSYEKAVDLATNNSLAYSRMGSLWYAARKYDDALKNFNMSKDADPSNPLPYKELAEAYQKAGKYDRALENIKKFIDLSDKSIDDQITYANLLFLSENYGEANVKIEELLANGVQKPYLYRLVGYSSYETKNYPKALEYMHKFFAIETRPDKLIFDDYLYMGRIMGALAASDAQHATLYNDSADFYLNKAVAMVPASEKGELFKKIADNYKDAKEYAKAGVWFGKVVANDPDAPAIDYFNWGLYAYYGQDLNDAAKAFASMRQKYPDEGSAIYWQARTAAAVDHEAKTGGAVQFYKEWLEFKHEGYDHKDSDLMNAYNYLAFYYYNTENEKEAMVWINKILEKEPQNDFANQVKDYYQKLKKSGAK